MEIKDIVIKRYKIRTDMLQVKSKFNKLARLERILDDCLTYESLKLTDPKTAQRFRKVHIETIKHGIFNKKIDFNGNTEELIKVLEG